MATLRPTDGSTSCTIYLGQFSWTYDGSTSSLCMFREGTCISEWYWDTPVNVTKFNIFSHYYAPDSRITGIWGRVGAGWFLLWGYDEWNPSHATWDSKDISCDNCTGIRISQVHAQQTLKPGIAEVSIDYEISTLTEAVTCKWVNGFQDHGPEVTQFDINEAVYAYAEIALHGNDAYGKLLRHEWWYNGVKRWEWQTICSEHYTNNWASWTWWAIGTVYGAGTGYIKIFFDGRYMGQTNDFTIVGAEGEAVIVDVVAPSTFTPSVQFRITVILRNDGASDTLFVKLINRDTGAVLHDEERFVYSGFSWTAIMDITLNQTTDFNWLIEAGHVED